MEPHNYPKGYVGERGQTILTSLAGGAPALQRQNTYTRVTCKRRLFGKRIACPALEHGKCAIDSRHHLFFSKNFEQMIETWPHVTAGDCESSWMDDRADFYA